MYCNAKIIPDLHYSTAFTSTLQMPVIIMTGKSAHKKVNILDQIQVNIIK
uniref:Uncharacterized protein n=1 Tax=Anguilla anguilla TaxID=7936 RepID=A0A0E9PYV6_ANGAN